MMNKLLRSTNITRGEKDFIKIFPIHLICVDSDLFFLPDDDKKTFILKRMYFHEINSIHGHDAFLIETKQISNIFTKIFKNERINNKYLFEVTNKNGHKVHLDRKYSEDYNVQGSSPMELLLMGVAGCSSIDIISILEKQKLQPESYKMEVFGDRESVPGSAFKKYMQSFMLKEIFLQIELLELLT